MADLKIDSLQLQIESDSKEANASLDRLIMSLVGVDKSLGRIRKNANAMQNLSRSLAALSQVRLPNFEPMISQLQNLEKINFEQLKNIKIGFQIDNGFSEAEKQAQSLEYVLGRISPQVKATAKELTKMFNLDADTSKNLQSAWGDMWKASASGNETEFAEINKRVSRILIDTGRVARSSVDESVSYADDKIEEFLNEFNRKSQKLYLGKENLSEAIGLQAGKTGRALGGNQRYVTSDKSNGIHLTGSTWEEFKDNYGNGKLFSNSELDNLTTVGERVDFVVRKIKELRNQQKETVPVSEVFRGMFGQDSKYAIKESTKNMTNQMEAAIKNAKQEFDNESSKNILLNFGIDENRLQKQVEDAVNRIRKHDYGTVDLKLNVDTNTMIQNLMKAFKADQFKGIATVSGNIGQVADAMHKFDGIDLRGNGIAQFVQGFGRLSKESKNLDVSAIKKSADAMREFKGIEMKSNGLAQFTSGLASLSRNSKDLDETVFTKVANGLQELERVSSVSGIAESFSSFIQSINAFIRSSSKMKETANNFPALALEMQEFFSAMSHMDISDNTVRMAEALAEISKSGKKAGTAMQELQKKSEETNTTVQKSTKVINGLCKVADALVVVMKKLGSVALNGVKRLVGQIGQLGKHTSSVGSLTSNIKTLLGTMIGFRGIQGVFNWTKEMVKMGADVTEIDHIVESVFGDMAGYVDKWATQAIDKFGIAATAAKQYAGTLSAMFQASNIGIKDSGKMALDLVELAGDLSAFYNIDTEDAYRKIQSGMAGMVRPLRSLGIDLSVASLKEFALSQGIEKSYTEMTQAEKVMLRYQYLMQNTTNQQGDFERTSLSLANSMRILRAYISEITTQLGVGFGAAVRHAVVWLNSLMRVILKASQAFAVFMQTLFGKYKGGASGAALGDYYGLDDAADGADALADGADDAADGLGDAADNAEKLKKDLSVLPFDELNQLNKDQEKTSSSNGKGSGGSGGGIGGLGDFGDGMLNWGEEEVDGALGRLEDKLSAWAERIKGYAKADNWFEVGGEIARGLNEGLKAVYELLDPNKLDDKVMPWVQRFVDMINGFIHYINFDLLGKTLGRGINDLVKIANGFLDPKTGINFKELGTRLGEGFMGMIREIRWKDLGNFISNKFMVAWRIFKGFVEELKPDEIGAAIRDVIAGAIENFDPVTIGGSIGMFITKIATSIKEGFADTQTWENLGTKMGDGINAFLKNFDGKEVAEGINSLLNAIITTTGSMLKRINVAELIRDIKDFYISLDWETISEFGAPLISTKFLTALGKAIVENILGMNMIAISIGNAIAKACSSESLTSALNSTASGLSNNLGQLLAVQLTGIETLVAPVASGLGINLISALLGEDTRGSRLESFETDVNTSFLNVEDTILGSGIRMVTSSATTVGQIAANFFGLRTSIEGDSEAIDTANTQTTNHWKDCYDLVLDHIRTFSENHDTELTLMQNKVGDFVSAVETGLSNSGNSWKTLEQDEQGHSESLIQSLQDQIDKVHEWEENLTILAKAGVDEGFLNELARMGTDGAPLVQSAVSQISTEGGLAELNQTWQDLINAQGMMDDVGKTLKEAGITNIQEAFGDLSKNVEDEQKNVNEGIARGQEMYAPLAKDAMEKTASDMFGAMREFNKTGSPSQTYEDESKNIIDGLVQGIDRNAPDIFTSMRNMATGMMDAFKEAINISGMINDAFSDISYICSTVEGYGSDIATSLANGLSGVTIPSIEVVVEYQWVDMGDGTQVEIPSWIYPEFHYYAKGGLFTDAAIFGEAGDEAALPLENNKVMKRVASAIVNSGGLGLDDSSLSSAVARGYVQAMIANQGNERPIQFNATLYTEDNEVLARAVSKGQQSIDYRNNPTTQLSY